MEKKYGNDENGNSRLMEANIKARLIQAKDGKLTLRLFLKDNVKRDFCLESGKNPNTIFENIIIL